MYRRSPSPYTATGLLVAVVAALWAFGTADLDPMQQVPGEQAQECEATFQPATIEAGTVHEEVRVTLSEEVGEVDEVDVPEESGLNILWVHEEQDVDAPERPERPATMAPSVRVSAVGAEPGEWEVTLHGETGNCSGKITVTEGR